jgi:hypothetical protein
MTGVFDPACLDIEIKDRFGQPVVPREWFLVPLFVIDEVVEKSKYPPAKPGALVLEPLKAAYPCRTTQASLPLCGMLYAS